MEGPGGNVCVRHGRVLGSYRDRPFSTGQLVPVHVRIDIAISALPCVLVARPAPAPRRRERCVYPDAVRLRDERSTARARASDTTYILPVILIDYYPNDNDKDNPLCNTQKWLDQALVV